MNYRTFVLGAFFTLVLFSTKGQLPEVYSEIVLKIDDSIIQFLADQKNEIEKYKWIESEKVGHDLGNCAIMDWIRKYAKKYRDQYRQTH